MKAKNQQNFTSELDAKDKLIIYVYEYLIHSGAKVAADKFVESIGYNKVIEVKEGPGFLLEWWCVFWDLYCAAPERRVLQHHPESSSDARAFHDYLRSTPMSPSITQTSPPQQPPQFIGGPRYGPPPPGQPPPRGPPPRMQGPPPPQHGGPPPPGPPGGFMPSASPRYAQHSAGPPPPPQSHMGQGGMNFGPGPDHQIGPSPGLNRMTPVGGPPPQQIVGPPGGPPPQMVGMPPGQQMGGPPGQGPSQVQMQSGGPPPRNGSQGNAGGWQGGGPVGGYGTVNSPANQPMYSSGPSSNQPNQPGPMMMSDGSGMMDVKSSPLNGGEPSTPHSDEYVMPAPVFGQEANDQCDSAEILKLKQSMQEDTAKMFEKDQSDFNLADYSDSQGKWS